MTTRARQAVKLGVFLLVLLAVGWHLSEQLRQLEQGDLRVRPGLLLTSLVVFTGLGLMSCLILAGYLRAFGHPVSARSGLALGTIPALGKYLPGRVHSVVGLAWLAKSLEGIPLRATLSAALLFSVQIVTVTMLTAAILAPLTQLPGLMVVLLWVAALLLLVLLTTPAMIAPINWVSRKLGKPELPGAPPTRTTVRLLVIGLVQRTGAVFAFGLMAYALVDLPARSMLDVGVSFILAAAAGLVAVFAPAGLGVQEGLLVVLLEQFMPGPQAAALTVAARIWETAMTLLAAGIGWVALASSRKSKELAVTSPD